MNWTNDDVAFLQQHYPQRGNAWCAERLGKTTNAVRNKASLLGIKHDRHSEVYAEANRKAAAARTGRKRPDHAAIMRHQYAMGKAPLVEYIQSERGRQENGERARQRVAENGHPRGMLGKSHKPEVKAAQGAASKARWESMTEDQIGEQVTKMMKTREANGTMVVPRMKQTWKAGWREIGGIEKYYRSRWEANYARILQLRLERGEILKWEHEPETFWFEGIKRGTRSYLPDFRVTLLDGSIVYHEVKGWMDDKSKTKIKRMALYHPNVKLEVYTGKEYRELARQYADIIFGWE